MDKFKPPHCDLTYDYSCESPRLRYAEGGRFLQLSFAKSPAARWNAQVFGRRALERRRGLCKGFSFGSRRRLLNRLNCVSVAAVMPSFLTMTLPDESYCEDLGEFAKRAKSWLDTWVKRLVRVCPGASGFWRIEWKDRKSGKHEGAQFPHFHLLVWGLPQRKLGEKWRGGEQWFVEEWEPYVDRVDAQLSFNLIDLWSAAGRAKRVEDLRPREQRVTEYSSSGVRVFQGREPFVARCRNLSDRCAIGGDELRKMSLQDWASLAWYHVVGSHNLDHVQAGVRVERVRSWGGVMWYAAKYLSKTDGVQHLVCNTLGRMWGVFNRVAVPWAKMVELDLPGEVGVRLRRIARKYLERERGRRRRVGYGITVYCDVARWRKLWQLADPDPF
jgi:hypothetical protein